ncbi:opsin-5-like [Nerophis lumbriciformis]|uniref:opsin-5-like n=1 Tax=Nerophis lumbriciformis TaxID=546530 RepID=UPI002AE00F10|nr:opsin-5-like [Nerophis lumbriciformis]XP_061835538.1 opsin-5-like [Nerophis lumbriciformis]XP_061835539.1 opsin-5-like [Nerophis lumbriciformis]XP_061835540.1 opsin-5-like [Nerophis lumbriciformis]
MGASDKDITFQSSIPVPLDITVAVVYSVFGLCSLFGNSTLLYVSYKKKHVLKPAEHFIINLAVSDLGLTLSLSPMAITSSVYHRWLYGRTACSIYAFCSMLFGICSLTTLTLLSVVCFIKVCYPFYGNRFNNFHGCLLISCAWVFALLFACCPLVHWGEYGPEPYGTACCIDWRLSNRLPTARSYTVALFFFCYILPCCIILASYTRILATVHASHKTMERHASRQAHMSSIQIIIVKLSVAVCIGFFMAWSPYALVSMWAAFGNIENIPPLAFAMPAMFAKSSTIYNPIIYLTLRPNFRKVICRDAGALRSCLCSWCCCRPKVGVRLRSVPKRSDRFPSPSSSTHPATIALKGQKDAFESPTPSPQVYSVTNPPACEEPSQDRALLQRDKQKHQSGSHMRSLLCKMCAKRTADSLHIDLEMVPSKAKVAWP